MEKNMNHKSIICFGIFVRIKLILLALMCRVQRVKYYDEGKLVSKGWYDFRNGKTYITWLKF